MTDHKAAVKELTLIPGVGKSIARLLCGEPTQKNRSGKTEVVELERKTSVASKILRGR